MQDPQYPQDQNQYDPRYQAHQGYYQTEPQEPPLDPAMEKVRRKMVRLLAVSIGVMIIGLMAVLGAVVYKVMGSSEPAKTEDVRSDIPAQAITEPVVRQELIESQLELPEGTRLLSQSLSGNHVSLETLLPDGGTEIIVYDYQESRIIARMRLGNVE